MSSTAVSVVVLTSRTSRTQRQLLDALLTRVPNLTTEQRVALITIVSSTVLVHQNPLSGWLSRWSCWRRPRSEL